jgi:phage shock protein C
MDNTKRLTLSSTDRRVSGVCGGIAAYFNVDSTLIRLLWVAFSLAYGSGLIMYIIGALVIPKE